MLATFPNKTRNTIIFIVMLMFTFIGYLYTNDALLSATIWPATGFAIGFYFRFGKPSLKYIFLGIFVGNMIARLFIANEPLYLAMILSLSFTTVNVLEAYIFKAFMDYFNARGMINTYSFIIYFSGMILIVLLGSLVSSLVIGLTFGFDQYLTILFFWFFGDLSGILLFGTTILLTFFYDYILPTKERTILGILFTLLFTAFSFVIFLELNSTFVFHNFGYIFVVFFLVAAFVFTYRMILTITAVYVVTYQTILYFDISHELHVDPMFFNLNLFILVYLACITRLILYTAKDRYEALQQSNEKLDKMIHSTHRLIRMKDIEISSQKDNVEYIKNIFEIALSLYDSHDKASCYIKLNNKPVFIAADGYDLLELNKLDWDKRQFQWALQKPQHVVNAEAEIKKNLKNDYQHYRTVIPLLKESIRFGIYIDDNITGGMSFDILADSDKRFTKSDFDNFDSFQKLMNSFYEFNVLSNKNLSLKNDIVLSLIKTLELYDQYTGGHSEEVATISREIAKKMKLSEQEIYDVYWAGVVHDIGKVGVSSDIINKKGKLTEQEYEMIKHHPEFGAKILRESADLADIATLVMHHHEWWNGNGYPSGLKKNQIPLGSQILCVADAISAMSGARQYSSMKSESEIIEELSLYTGVQFNPKITMVAIDLINNGLLKRIKKS